MANKRKWVAELLELHQSVDQNDRPVSTYQKKRIVYYSSIGIWSDEKYQSRQDKREVVKRISIVMDRTITETGNRIKILGMTYLITRIFIDEAKREMELSLAHVN